MATADNQLKTAGLTADDLRALLDTLDAAPRSPAAQKRRHRRLPYRSLHVIIRVLDQHKQVTATFQVPTRNISARGLGFVHRQMLAPGQLLHLEIPLLDDERLCAMARVARCRHVKGMVHEIGVEFLAPPERGPSGPVLTPPYT